MKKILFVSAMLFITGFSIISCKKDSTSTSTSIVGTWEATSTHAVEFDSAVSVTHTTDSIYTHGHAGKVTFNADNTYSISDPYDAPPSTEAGTYTIANGKLTTTPTSSTGTLGIPLVNAAYSIADNKLTIISKTSVPTLFSVTVTNVMTRQ